MKPFLQLLLGLRESGIEKANLDPVVSGFMYPYSF